MVANRFDPFRDLDRLAERVFSASVDLGQSMRAMPMDLYRDGDHWTLVCDLPGVDPASVDVDDQSETLVVRVEPGADVTAAVLGELGGIQVGRVVTREPTLEDAYVELVQS